jgi:2'-5' RNA ligase
LQGYDCTSIMSNRRRLFFAFWPDPSQQAALAEATRGVVERSGGQRVPPENLHITLVFVGSVPESEIVRVESIAANVAQAVGPAPALVALDFLDYWKKPRVVCLTTQQSADAQASRIADLLTNRLTTAGFAPDIRPFRPHVTLARKASHGSMDTLQPLLWTFREFSLIGSQTGPSGSVYSCRARFTFSVD